MVFCLGLVYLNFIEITQARKRVEDNFSYWQGVVKKNPNFTQGYYNAGLYASELGDYKSAVNFLDQAIRLDPTFKKAILLEKEILR